MIFMNKLLRFTGKMLFPERCRFCNRVIDIRKTVCKNCEDGLKVIDGEICYLCGCKQTDCKCKKHKSFYDAVVAPYYYEGSAGLALRNLKFNGIKSLAEHLYTDMAKCFNERYSEYSFDFICFVPMTEKSKKERGFNQSQILADGVSKLTGIPVINALKKTAETDAQHNLSGSLRSGNVKGVFEINETFSDRITDARILLCDDIKTTGSTLNECAATLKIGGATEVFCLTAAIANINR